MESKRFIVEIGTGMDLHGEDATKAACRAVKDAISRSCLCGLVEILGIDDLMGEPSMVTEGSPTKRIKVDILVACPKPDEVDLEEVKLMVPIGEKTARSVGGGMVVPGVCVPHFAPTCDQIIVANAAITVSVV